MGGGEASFDPGPMTPGGGPRKLGNGGGRTGAVLMVDRRKEGSRGIPSSPGPIFSRSPKMGGKAVPCIPGELDLVDVIGVLYGEPEDMGGAELNAEKGRLADEDELDGENAERSCESENADRSDAGGVAASSALARDSGAGREDEGHARMWSKRDGMSRNEGKPSSPWNRPTTLDGDDPLDEDDSGNL